MARAGQGTGRVRRRHLDLRRGGDHVRLHGARGRDHPHHLRRQAVRERVQGQLRPGLASERVVGTRREELLALGRRSRQVIVMSAITGLVTGAGVGLFEELTSGVLFERVTRAPLAVQAGAPLVGLLLAAAALTWLAKRASPSTADEYIKNFHERDRRLPLQPVFGRLVASACTLGSGGALGFEGPSIYLGASA